MSYKAPSLMTTPGVPHIVMPRGVEQPPEVIAALKALPRLHRTMNLRIDAAYVPSTAGFSQWVKVWQAGDEIKTTAERALLQNAVAEGHRHVIARGSAATVLDAIKNELRAPTPTFQTSIVGTAGSALGCPKWRRASKRRTTPERRGRSRTRWPPCAPGGPSTTTTLATRVSWRCARTPTKPCRRKVRAPRTCPLSTFSPTPTRHCPVWMACPSADCSRSSSTRRAGAASPLWSAPSLGHVSGLFGRGLNKGPNSFRLGCIPNQATNSELAAWLGSQPSHQFRIGGLVGLPTKLQVH